MLRRRVPFLRDETAGGVVLLAATIVALVWANAAGDGYLHTWDGLRHTINDGLMALFFFVVGLEIKRELVVGELRERRAAALPVIAAAGGVLLPMLIFTAIVAGGDGAKGWAIPAATDIAFAVGVLTLFGDRVSSGARLLLLTIAIVDDIIAIAIIALFYGGGIHASVVGVAVAFLVPMRVLPALEHHLHPLSAFVVVPLFALANAGVDLGGGVLERALESRLTWAIVVALVAGKLVGISGATLLALRRRIGALPGDVRRHEVFGVAATAGIGFTVSLFITQLAFDDPVLVDEAKVGIFLGSILSGLLGAALLRPLRRRAAR